MRKIALTFIVCLVTIVGQAQEYLRFMDIPIEGSFDEFYGKLIKEKGLLASEMTEGEEYMNMKTKKLKGDYYGTKNCTFYVRKHDRLNSVSSVIVVDTLGALSGTDAQKFIAIHDAKFGSHKVDSARYSIWYTWETEKGEVEVGLNNSGFRIFYTDHSEKEIHSLECFKC